jgi:2-oxoisovalerate dehydrogenase E1 component alpha subunit
LAKASAKVTAHNSPARAVRKSPSANANGKHKKIVETKKSMLAHATQGADRTEVYGTHQKTLPLDKALLLKMHEHMVTSRVLEERLIKIYKTGQAFFWIGGPGEEAWGVALGMLVNKGQGLAHDWLHLHYRCTPTLVALGMPMIDSIRLIMSKTTDPSTGGRNFSNHYCYPKWNVAPVTSPIEVQYQIALGTAWAQRRYQEEHGGRGGISIITGGDAGTAEGDFASCLVWASRKGFELPLLITVQNNKWGISTSYEGQHGEQFIADRGKAFGIRTAVINGNDPIETYIRLQEEFYYIRRNHKPVLVEAYVSRLYGHSSASGANFVSEEVDPLTQFQSLLFKHGVLKQADAKALYQRLDDESRQIAEAVKHESEPDAASIWDHVYANNENADWRKF